MYDYVYSLIASSKYPSIFILMFIFPTEAVMPIVGYAASRGLLNLPMAVLVGTAGTTAWAIAIYALARQTSQENVYSFIDKYGRWIGIRRRNAMVAGKWFDRHAKITVLVGRFIPGLRTAVSIPAGFRRMRFLTFVTYTALGSLLCSSVLAYLGYRAGSHISELVTLLDGLSTVILLALVGLVLAWVLLRRYRKGKP
jgi:membrane protein DedA with SNARE-associated domain